MMIPRIIGQPRRVWPATRYVDYSVGDDTNAGDSPYAPWKRAPGDPLATGAAAAYTPPAGAIIQLKSGVVYRGTIEAKASGTIASPIIYRGRGWGDGRAIIDGADLYTCAAASCGGDMSVPAVVRSDQYLVVSLPGGLAPQAWRPILLDGNYLEWSQYPTPPDPWAFDRLDLWLQDSASVRAKAAFNGQRYDATLQSSLILTALAGDPAYDLSFRSFGYATLIFTPESCTYDAGTNTLTGARMLVPSNGIGGADGSSVSDPFVLCNHPRFLARAGQYCSIDAGARIIVRRAEATPFSGTVQVQLAVRAVGLNAKTFSDVRFEGFEIRNQGGPPSVQSVYGVGSGASGERQDADDIYVHHVATLNGGGNGVIVRGIAQRVDVRDTWELRGVNGYRVLDSEITNISHSGISIQGGTPGVSIERVRIFNLQSPHGNGMSWYTEPNGIEGRNITIIASNRPITCQGPTMSVKLHRSVLSGGDFTGTVGYPQWFPRFEESQGGFINWSAAAGISIENCVLLSTDGNNGIYLNNTAGVDLLNNVVQGMVLNGAASTDAFAGNLFLDATGYSGANTLDTGSGTLAAARAFASFTPTYDAALVTVLRGGSTDPDFYVGCPNWSDVQAPVITAQPAISGTPGVGQTLTCAAGSCAQNKYNTVDYQWFVGGVGQVGAESPTFVVPAGASGQVVSCRVRHHNRVATVAATATIAIV